MASLLEHLEAVGFPCAPRFRGIDDRGRYMVDYVDGDTYDNPPWQHDDTENAKVLGALARSLKSLHTATIDFSPPSGLQPVRPLPIPGTTWTHGDVGYANIVWDGSALVAFIDWEFAAPGDPLVDPAGLLAVNTRGPRPDVDDNARRAAAFDRAAESIGAAFGLDDLAPLVRAAATVLEDAADYWTAIGLNDVGAATARWRAVWLRENRVS